MQTKTDSMIPTVISFTIDSKTYQVRTADAESIRQLPDTVRQQLICLLEEVKAQDRLQQANIRQSADQTVISNTGAADSPISSAPPEYTEVIPSHLGKGDMDAMVESLIAEERMKQKKQITKSTLYKWIVVLTAVIILLITISQ